MALQRTTEGMSGSHSYSQAAAEPFAIRSLREIFLSYPPAAQARIRADVIARLRAEARGKEFRNQRSALSRLAGPVYGITERDL